MEAQVPSLGWEDPLEEEMATHCSNLALKTPQTEEPGKLKSMGVIKESDMTEGLNNNGNNLTVTRLSPQDTVVFCHFHTYLLLLKELPQ